MLNNMEQQRVCISDISLDVWVIERTSQLHRLEKLFIAFSPFLHF